MGQAPPRRRCSTVATLLGLGPVSWPWPCLLPSLLLYGRARTQGGVRAFPRTHGVGSLPPALPGLVVVLHQCESGVPRMGSSAGLVAVPRVRWVPDCTPVATGLHGDRTC